MTLRTLCRATVAIGLVLVSGGVLAASAAEGPRNIAGVWQITSYQTKLQPMEGGAIPFTPAGKAAYDKNVAGLKDGSVQDFALTLCLPPGVTRAMGLPDPLEIVQAPGLVAILLRDFFRVISLDAPHAEDLDVLPSYMGDSVAHWDGDTLVIDTLGFNVFTWLDASGVPHGYDLHTVEHIRKLDAKHLENVITIEDGEFFAKPWNVRYVYESHPYVSRASGIQPCDAHTGVNLP